jgi:hypothetical protein
MTRDERLLAKYVLRTSRRLWSKWRNFETENPRLFAEALAHIAANAFIRLPEDMPLSIGNMQRHAQAHTPDLEDDLVEYWFNVFYSHIEKKIIRWSMKGVDYVRVQSGSI